MKTILFGRNSFIAQHILDSNQSIIAYGNYFYSEQHIHDFFYELPLDVKVIINCIGKTGSPNIDSLENQKEHTFFTNTILPIIFACRCAELGIYYIQLSSGCCFYGKSPNTFFDGFNYEFYDKAVCSELNHIDVGWKESDFANPASTYSRSKYASDLVLEKLDNVCILRLRMPVSYIPSPRNLLSKIISYKQVIEEPNSITFVDDLVRAISFVIEKQLTGIYHIASPKHLTHSVFLEEYKKRYNPAHEYEKITNTQLNELVAAPRSNCILNVEKIQKEGFIFEDTKLAVRRYVKKFVENIKDAQ